MVSPSRNALLLAVGSWLHPQGIERKIIGKSSLTRLDTMVTICYHMLPYVTMVSRNSTSNFLGFRTQMNPVRCPMRPMVLKSKNDIWPLGEVHDLEVRGFGATFWSFPGCKNNGQSGVIEIFSKVSRRVYFEF